LTLQSLVRFFAPTCTRDADAARADLILRPPLSREEQTKMQSSNKRCARSRSRIRFVGSAKRSVPTTSLAMTWTGCVAGQQPTPAFQFCDRSHVHIQIPLVAAAIYCPFNRIQESQRKLSPMAEAAKSRSEAQA